MANYKFTQDHYYPAEKMTLFGKSAMIKSSFILSITDIFGNWIEREVLCFDKRLTKKEVKQLKKYYKKRYEL
jgi:hypothetical protein